MQVILTEEEYNELVSKKKEYENKKIKHTEEAKWFADMIKKAEFRNGSGSEPLFHDIRVMFSCDKEEVPSIIMDRLEANSKNRF